MNFLHVQISHVARSTGRSAVQAVAYIAGEKLVEERRGIIADYRNVRGRNFADDKEVFCQTLVPEGSGIEATDLGKIWNRFENYEDEYALKRYRNPETQTQYMASARVAQTYIVALPKELPQTQNIELVREFTQKRFVDQGLVATYAIHWEEGNPHAHIQVSTRTVSNGEISWTKEVSRTLASPPGIRVTRKLLADTINEYQERAGILRKVDHRSFAERGIDLLPTKHKGWMAHKLEREGKYSRIVADNVQIVQENKDRIADDPQIILKMLTSTQATFSELDVVRLTQQRLKDDPGVLSEYVINAVMKEAVEVGVGIDHAKRYTSKEYFEKEERILASLASYANTDAAIPIDADLVEQYINEQKAAPGGLQFNEGQKQAIRTLCGNNQLSIMVGRAGTGKTTALRAVVEIHERAGYKVWGMTPSATAAHELWKGAGCHSDTIASHAYHWKKYYDAVSEAERSRTLTGSRASTGNKIDLAKLAKRLPDDKTLILLDEAGMVGVGGWDNDIPGGWDALVKVINMTGAKIIPVGDDHQYKPVESGDVLRKVIEKAKSGSRTSVGDRTVVCELERIMRQDTPWMVEASHQLAQLNTATALEMYEHHGHIQEHKTSLAVYEDMAQQYLRNITRDPSAQGVVLAALNEECQKLNREIRSVLKANGLLPQEDALTIGEDGYAVGDKIVFTKNDRNYNTQFSRGSASSRSAAPGLVGSTADENKFFVRNGMQAVIESIEPCWIRDRFAKDDQDEALIETFEIVARVVGADGQTLTGNRSTQDKVRFYLHNYQSFTHGYAVTGHKSQGMTVDWSLVKLSKNMDAYALYVTLTRHKYDTSVYYSKEDFADFATMIRSVGKVSFKDLVIDYTIPDESKEHWWNVQDYKALGAEMLQISAFGRSAAVRSPTEVQPPSAVRSPTEVQPPTESQSPEQSEKAASWREHRRLKTERAHLAKVILGEREGHKDFIRQAGLTFEALEIAAGLKKRPLSRLEVQACLVVEQYVASALEARELWNSIRRTHPGSLAKSHPEWKNFEGVRDQRGRLANQIAYDPALYRPFLKENVETLGQQSSAGGHSRPSAIPYSMRVVQAQAEAHQSKMLQQAMLRETADSTKHEMLKALIGYVEARDFSGSMWQQLKPKLKEFEGTLLKDSFAKDIDEYKEMRALMEGMALKIMDAREGYEALALQVGIKLDFAKLTEQAMQGKRNALFKQYMAAEVEGKFHWPVLGQGPTLGWEPGLGRGPHCGRGANLSKLKAAYELNALMQAEAAVRPQAEVYAPKKKITIAQVYSNGLQPKDIALDALKYQRLQVFAGLATEPERQLFTLLEQYDAQCRTANQIYVRCLPDTKNEPVAANSPGKPTSKPWNSPHYPAYKAACDIRNETALQVFNQHNHDDALQLADAMGVKFKEVELEGIFARCEQATRTAHIQDYLAAGDDKDKKGQAAVDLLKLIDFERKSDKQNGRVSVTATQAYYAGIDLKVLQVTAFEHKRASYLRSLSNERADEEVKIFYALQGYEEASREAKKAYVSCLEEGKTKAVKPWETTMFKDYLTLINKQDGIAHDLLTTTDSRVLSKVAQGMAISLKGLDVEAHWHSLRNTLQIFTDGDRTNVPMAAHELLNWLAFDRHADFKHTFKVLREQDLFPQDIKNSLAEFHEKKKALRRAPEATDDRRSASRSYLPSKEIEEQLKGRMEELAIAVLGKQPSKRSPTQLRFGRGGSLQIHTGGNLQGLYCNYESGDKGGPLKFIEVEQRLGSWQDAAKWASDWLRGGASRQRTVDSSQRTVTGGQDAPLSTGDRQLSTVWTPIVPVPASVADPDIAGNKYLNVMLSDGGKETGRYAYRDEDGNLKGYVVRIEKPDPNSEVSKKSTPPLAYCENQQGFRCWRWQGFESKNRTPYGLEKLARDPHKPVLIVEGEKTADAAQKLLPQYHVLSWCGGASAVGNTNWVPLVGRTVAIWPDNDAGGFKAADKLQKIVSKLNAEQEQAHGVIGKGTIAVVAIPGGELPGKWDLADKLPANWTVDTVRQMIKEAVTGATRGAAHQMTQDRGQTTEVPATVRFVEPALGKSEAQAPLSSDAKRLDSAVHKFISLSKEHAMAEADSKKCGEFSSEEYWRRNEMKKSISRIAAPYLNDERFLAKIDESNSKEAADRLAKEIQTLNRSLSRDRGMER